MADDDQWFIAERARALAIVLLTRRSDLVVREAKQEYGFDLLVEIKSRKSAARRLGVLLQGGLSPVEEQQADEVLKPSVQRFRRSEPPSFPACLFYFTMEDNQAYYTWIAEPLITDDGKPKHNSSRTTRRQTPHLKRTSARAPARYCKC